ncbi:ZPR1 zinc finger domain-containing protein [Candidatus Woesearchaeota archaeon]|nr:ZPR1 zinc finger domain-containing protein [Candidatus Woesearchaeota archaeon]
MSEETDYEQVTGETCPICSEKTLTLMETRKEVPYFGMCYLFSMDCSSCNYHKADLEAEETHDPAKYSFIIESEEDLKVRVIKSSNATVKIGTVGSMEPGEAANGYITNVEGLLNRIKTQVEHLKAVAGDEGDKASVKKAKNHLKKLQRALWGQEPMKIILNDPTGNSAIISPKAEKK